MAKINSKKTVKKKAKTPREEVLQNLTSLPSKPQFDKHFWADFIEIKCITNKDNVFTIDEFVSLYEKAADLQAASWQNTEEDDDELESDEFDYVPKDDKRNIFASGLFSIISSRREVFKEYYPFAVGAGLTNLKLKARITEKHKVYIFLLLASALNYTSPYQKELTDSFEIFCVGIMKSLLPAHAETHLFGSSNGLFPTRRYTGKIFNKIELLGKDLNENFLKVEKRDFPPTSTGDGGLDIISWISNGDHQSSIMTFSGQAGCTKDWDIKQFSSSYEAWKNKIPFTVSPMNFVFAPFSLRRADGTWNRGNSDLGNSVLIDRQRLIYHYTPSNNFKKLPCYKVVNEFITIKEGQ